MLQEETKFNLKTAGEDIKSWKASYFRKTCKQPAKISAKCYHPPAEECFWKYYVMLSVGTTVKKQTQITKEAYDALTWDPELEQSNYQSITFTTLHSFTPENKKD